jgi:hypothetical protein
MNSFPNMMNRLRSQKNYLLQESSNYWRFYKQIVVRPTDIINQKEILIAGLRRTGNHAIIGWIRAQHPDKAWHLNHPPAGQNPYQFLYSHFKKPEFREEAIGNFSKKSLLLISYEDQKLEKIGSEKFEKFHDIYVGASANRFDVLILRDPFNLIASRLQSNMSKIDDGSASQAIALWKSYAREFLGETQFLTHNKLCVNFNQWHYSQQYRQELATSLEIEFTDAGREQIKGYGGGSSFDGCKLDGRASELDILNRWQSFENIDSFWQLLKDEELVNYAERIFDRETLPFDRLK